MGHTGAPSTVHTEGTDNQSDGGTLGHCQLCIQRAQTTRQGVHPVGHTGALSTVHTEGIDNQPDWGTLGHCLLYIQKALATSRGGERLGTDNQTDWGGTTSQMGHTQ